jgi:hypothetical protein
MVPCLGEDPAANHRGWIQRTRKPAESPDVEMQRFLSSMLPPPDRFLMNKIVTGVVFIRRCRDVCTQAVGLREAQPSKTPLNGAKDIWILTASCWIDRALCIQSKSVHGFKLQRVTSSRAIAMHARTHQKGWTKRLMVMVMALNDSDSGND